MSLADEKEPLRVLWYGDPGSSKTTNMADMARLGTIHVIDADAGMKKRALADFGIPAENIEPYRDIRFSSLDALTWEIRAALDADADSIFGLCMDTSTEVCQRLLSLIVDEKNQRKIEALERKGEDSSEVDPFFRDRDFYQTLTEQMRRLTRGWKDLNIHLGITAHVRRDTDDDTGKTAYGPDVPPAVGSLLAGAVDVIARCRVDGFWPAGYAVAGQPDMDVMVADLRKAGPYDGKDRFHRTPRVLVNPTFGRIQAYIEGALTAENDEQQAAYRELYKSRKAEAQAVEEARAARKAEARARRTGTKTAAAKKTAASKPDADDDDGEGGGEDQ